MMDEESANLRYEMMRRGYKHYQVAEHMGVLPEAFSRMMRSPVKPENAQKIYKAIEEMDKERGN